MNEDTQMDRNACEKRLRRYSRIAEWLSVVGMFVVGAGCAYLLTDHNALLAYLQRDVPATVIVTPSQPVLWTAYAVALIPAAIFLLALWETRRFFALIGTRPIFDSAASRSLMRLGYMTIAICVSQIVVRTTVVLLMTSANPPGQRQLAIGIGSTDIAALIIGFLFFTFALVMQEASRLARENQEFV